jgi:hypothetical protein
MNTSFGLIYFIHDDPSSVFKLNIIPTISDARFNENIKVVLVHNKRHQHVNGTNTLITYTTEVSHIVKGADGKSTLDLISTEKIWQDGFKVAFDVMKGYAESGRFVKLGMITLSHSNGFVINRNGESTAAALEVEVVEPNPNLRKIKKDIDDHHIFLNSLTVLEQTVQQNGDADKALFKTAYTRVVDSKTAFCQKYEGLFLAEFSKFLKELLTDFNSFIKAPPGTKMSFFISSNCNFQLYDNLLLFAPLSDFIMGAQSLNSIRFWHFPSIINAIRVKMEDSNKDLCRFIFDICTEQFEEEDQSGRRHYFLTGTHNFSELHLKFEMIVRGIKDCIKNDNSFAAKLLKRTATLKVTSGFEAIPFLDILQIFDEVAAMQPVQFLETVSKFRCLLNEAITASFLKEDNFCGFSLYLPRNKEEFNALTGPRCNYFLNTESRSDFALHSSFDEVLSDLFKEAN